MKKRKMFYFINISIHAIHIFCALLQIHILSIQIFFAFQPFLFNINKNKWLSM